MSLTPRQQIILDFHALQRGLHQSQTTVQHTLTAFIECDVSASFSRLVPLTVTLETAVEHCKAITASMRAIGPAPSEPLPPLDAIHDMLACACEALNIASRFNVPRYRTDSRAIAAQLSEILTQLGGRR